MSYVDEVLAKVKAKNASEPEFLQAVEEVLNSPEDESVIANVRSRVNEMMKNYPMFAY